ncbi:MAG: hypothetical protein HY423_03610 [Candidatus Lambdaproteobacteria bacterium]|nr:hypothetical protein [Candidatus Lambdaproteobacteria bacterium]
MAGCIFRNGIVVGLLLLCAAPVAVARKHGGVLHTQLRDSPAELSLHESQAVDSVYSTMRVYNNPAYYGPFEPVESPATIRPEWGESWSWNADRLAEVWLDN